MFLATIFFYSAKIVLYREKLRRSQKVPFLIEASSAAKYA
jgi:hypothetical protein